MYRFAGRELSMKGVLWLAWWFALLMLVQLSCGGDAVTDEDTTGKSESALCSTSARLTMSSSTWGLGHPVSFTMTASCAAGEIAEFQLWVLAPGAGEWERVLDWSTTGTVSWTPSVEGYHRIIWYVRPRGASAAEAKFENSGVAVPPEGCTAISATFSPNPGSVRESPVVITPSATCGSLFEYRIWLDPPAPGTADVVYIKQYGDSSGPAPDSPFVWDTSRLAPGTYRLGIVARRIGSPSDYETGSTYYINILDSLACTSASLNLSPNRATAGAKVKMQAAATCPGTGVQFRFLMKQDAGNLVLRDYSTDSAFELDTTGMRPGTYRLAVEVRNPAVPSGTVQSSAEADFVVDPSCNAVTAGLSLSRSTGFVGEPVTFTMSATCSTAAAPEFQLWILAPGANAWNMLLDWSASRTVTWTPSIEGNHRIIWYLRAQGASAAESRLESAFIAVPPEGCTAISATFSPNPASIREPPVIITPHATCGSPFEYRIWLDPPTPGTADVVYIKQYGDSSGPAPDSPFVWDTSNLAPGTYRVGIVARRIGSPSDSETGSIHYINVVDSIACTAASLSLSPNRGSAGTTIRLRAAATCPSTAVEYRFSLYQDAGDVVLRDYSTESEFDWDTSGMPAGTYRLLLDARPQGSSSESVKKYGDAWLTLDPSPCSAVAASAYPNPTMVGSTVTLQATATCSTGSPQYRFRIQSPNGEWQEAQPYSAEATLRWSTAGLAVGSYLIEVAAKIPDLPGDFHARTLIYEQLREYAEPTASVVKPFVDCIATDEAQRSFAIFGYENPSTVNISVPRGSDNGVTPSIDTVQPSWFAPGTHSGALVAELSSSLTWTVGPNSATAVLGTSPTCMVEQTDTGGKEVALPSGQRLPIHDNPGGGIVDTETTPSGDVAGVLGGSFHVTHDGSAAYSIPIWFPPAPIQPHFSLQYDSRSGNGLYGLGWSLASDIPLEITRCRRTVGQDGYADHPRFAPDDALCMGSQRLVPVSKNEGISPTEYRLQEDSYTKILGVYNSNGGTGLQEYTAYLKDGRIAKYGPYEASPVGYTRAEDGTVTATGPFPTVILGWELRTVADRSGNELSFTYHNSSTSAHATEHYLEKVEFLSRATGNGPKISRRIRFEYNKNDPSKIRADRFSQFTGGTQLATRVLASAIVVESGMVDKVPENRTAPLAMTLRRYELDHTPAPENGLALLTSIRECDGAGKCKKPTKFDYTPFDIDFEHQTLDSDIIIDNRADQTLLVGDLNGDGLDDIVYKTFPHNPMCRLWYRLSTGKGFGPAVEMVDIENAVPGFVTEGQKVDIRMFDLDTDGLADILVSFHRGGTSPDAVGHWVLFQTKATEPLSFVAINDGADSPEWKDNAKGYGSGTNSECSSLSLDAIFGGDSHCEMDVAIAGWGGPPPIYIGDVDGDGSPDLLRGLMGRLGNLAEVENIGFWGVRRNQGSMRFGAYREIRPTSTNPNVPQALSLLQVYGARTLLGDVDGSGRLALIRAEPKEIEQLAMDREQGKPNFFIKNYIDYDFVGGNPDSTTPLSTTPEQNGYLTIASVPYKQNPYLGRVPLGKFILADMNGDGLPDAVEYPTKGGDGISVAFNYGGNFATPKSASGALGEPFFVGQSMRFATVGGSLDQAGICEDEDLFDNMDNGLRLADINQDGRQDIVLMDMGVANHGATVSLRDIRWNCAGDGADVGKRTQVAYLYVDDDGTWHAASVSPGIPVDAHFFGAYYTSRVADINGDGLPDLLNTAADKLQVWTQKGKGGMLRSVDNAYGRQVNVEYAPIADRKVHTPATGDGAVKRGMWLVSAHEVNSGTSDGMSRFEHQYKGALRNLMQGWLGFQEHQVKALRTHTTTTTSFEPDKWEMRIPSTSSSLGAVDFPYRGKPKAERTVVDFGQGHSLETRRNFIYETNMNAADYPYPAQSRTRSYRVNLVREITNVEDVFPSGDGRTTVRATLRELVHDFYGNVTDDVTVVSDSPIPEDGTLKTVVGDKTTIKRWYLMDASNWLIGREYARTIENEMVDGTSTKRTFKIEYEPSQPHLVHSFTVEPKAGGSLERITTYDHDAFGRITQITESAVDEEDRVTQITYDRVTGTLPAQVVNAEGHIATTTFEPMHGLPVTVQDSNGITHGFRYDGFGRLRQHVLPTGLAETTSYSVSGSGNMELTMTTPQSGATLVEFDSLERPMAWITNSFDNVPRTVARVYDAMFGGVAQEIGANDANTPAVTTVRSVDYAGRPKSVSVGNDLVTMVYDGRTTTQTEPKGRRQVITHDLNGRMVTREETYGSRTLRTDYTYKPFGLLGTITDPGQNGTDRNVTTFYYDDLGRKGAVRSKSSGLTTFWYNAFGELIKEIDANNVAHMYKRDRLGRVYEETVGTRVATTEWDHPEHGIGKAGRQTSLDGVITEFAYDGAGRTSKRTKVIQDVPYSVDLIYHDKTGLLQSVVYPGLGNGPRFAVEYGYKGNGELETVTGRGGTPEYWRATDRNVRGQATEEIYGDGVTVSRTYESTRGLPWEVHIKDGTTALDDCTYEYESSRFLSRRYHPGTGGTSTSPTTRCTGSSTGVPTTVRIGTGRSTTHTTTLGIYGSANTRIFRKPRRSSHTSTRASEPGRMR